MLLVKKTHYFKLSIVYLDITEHIRRRKRISTSLRIKETTFT